MLAHEVGVCRLCSMRDVSRVRSRRLVSGGSALSVGWVDGGGRVVRVIL